MKSKSGNIKLEEGFSIVELIIVLGIVIIILSISVPSLAKYLETAKTTADKATAKTIATAAELMRIENNKESITLEELKQEGYLDNIPIPQAKDKESFIIKIDNNTIKVYYDGETGEELYPGIKND